MSDLQFYIAIVGLSGFVLAVVGTGLYYLIDLILNRSDE